MFRAVFLPIIRSLLDIKRHWYNLCSSVADCCQNLLVSFISKLQISIKVLGIKFHDNPSSGSCSDACVQKNRQKQRQTDGRTDVKKLIVSLRINANALKTARV